MRWPGLTATPLRDRVPNIDKIVADGLVNESDGVLFPVKRVLASGQLYIHPSGMAPISTVSSTEVLAGLVDRVTFHNPENGFCVLRVKARGQRDLVTLVGHAAMISAGEFLGQRPYARRSVQSGVSQGHGTDHHRGHREISRLRHDPRHRACLCEKAGARLRRSRIRRHRAGAASPVRSPISAPSARSGSLRAELIKR